MNFTGLIIVVLFCAINQINVVDSNNTHLRLFKKVGNLTESNDGFTVTKEFYITRTLKMNWPKAVMFCENYGMEIASIRSSLESVKFLELVNEERKIFNKIHLFYEISNLLFLSNFS